MPIKNAAKKYFEILTETTITFLSNEPSKEHLHERMQIIGLKAVGSDNIQQCLLPKKKKKDRLTRLIKKVILYFRH